jgi:formiminotetrahydrofolate cyclodeaminase
MRAGPTISGRRAEKMIKDQSLQCFLDTLASERPTPGGGSAAAVAGAMSAALISMVCNLTIGKPRFAHAEAEMLAVRDAAESLRYRLTSMIEEDIAAFEGVMAAYRLPKDTDEQRRARSERIQSALKQATEVPLECARVCARLVDLSRVVAEKGNVNVVSDAGVAVLAAWAAMRSAALNVYVNAARIEDRSFLTPRTLELQRLLEEAGAGSEAIYELVKSRL